MDSPTYQIDRSHPANDQQGAGFDPTSIKPLPVCEVCGRQDETLRIVSYPFVVSLLVVTFRKSFSGLWCRTHRLQKLGLASLITVVIGWLGIPFGIFFTPVALFKLARGGDQPPEANRSLLKELAEIKFRKGDTIAAARCLEQALTFGDVESLRRALARLYQISPASVPSPPRTRFLAFLVVLVAASILGLAIGVVDYLITSLFVGLVGESASLYVIILSWIPLVALIFFGGLALSWMVRWALASSQTQGHLLGVALASLASFLAFYGIYQGELIIDFLITLFTDWPYTSLSDTFFGIGSFVTQGGYWVIEGSIVSGEIVDIIFLLITVIGGGFYLAITLAQALATVDWERLLVQAMPAPARGSALGGWAAVGGTVVSLALVTLLFLAGPQVALGGDSQKTEALLEEANTYFAQGDYDTGLSILESAVEQAPRSYSAHLMLGWAYYYSGEYDNARVEFETVQEMDPRMPDSYLGIGFIQNMLDEYDAAKASFEKALGLATDEYSIAQAHYGLGEGFYFQDNLDEAIAHLEQAIQYDPTISIASLELCFAYTGRGEFSLAISRCEILAGLDPQWAAPHALLAMLHYATDNPAGSEIELARALALNPEDAYSLYTLAGAYSYMLRFPKAEEIALRLYELTPDSVEVLTYLAELYAAQGNFQLAMDTISSVFVLDDSYMQAYLSLAQLYVYQEQLDMAFESLQQSRQALPDDRSSSSMFAYVHYLRGELTEAKRAAEDALELNPYDGDAHRTLAFVLLDQGDLEGAYEAALEALRLIPKSDTAHYGLGLILIERGDTTQGIHELETFLELYWDRAHVREYKDNAESLLAELKGDST